MSSERRKEEKNANKIVPPVNHNPRSRHSQFRTDFSDLGHKEIAFFYYRWIIVYNSSLNFIISYKEFIFYKIFMFNN